MRDFWELYPKTYYFCALRCEIPKEKAIKGFKELTKMGLKLNLRARMQKRATMELDKGTATLGRLEWK